MQIAILIDVAGWRYKRLSPNRIYRIPRATRNFIILITFDQDVANAEFKNSRGAHMPHIYLRVK